MALSPELMRSRYVKPGAELVAPDNILPHVARTAGGRDKAIEFWGEIKIRNRQQLEVVEEISLRMLGISGPCSKELQFEMEEFGHLRGIDLAGNLLSDWEDVLTILRQFPKLQNVSVASNRINDLGSTSSIGEFPHIRSLNLNNCNISSFQTLRLIGKAMPNLEELCVAHADLSDIEQHTPDTDTIEELFPNLILLDLSDCKLTSWENHIQPFRNLPMLESLILNLNAIDSIVVPESDNTRAPFPSLASLQIAGNPLPSWTALDDLNSITSLRSLRLRSTPLTNLLGVGEVRSTAIARFPSLEFFNASPISERERNEAERRYVSTVARELLLISSGALLSTNNNGLGTVDSSGDSEVDAKQAEVFARHPRFKHLMTKHKDTMMALNSSAAGTDSSGSGKIGEDVINVTIRSMAASSCDVEPLQKRLPRSLQVGRIKAMCARAFGLDIDLQILHFRIEVSVVQDELYCIATFVPLLT